MNTTIPQREELRQLRTKADMATEYATEMAALRSRKDYLAEYDYFLDLLGLLPHPERFRERFKKPLVGLTCVQAPLELVDALGFHPYRLCAHASSRQRLVSSQLPSLACPLIKSILGSFHLDDSLERLCDLTVIPGSCDWMAKLPEALEGRAPGVHVMELPRIRESERGQRRWLEEVKQLKRVLEKRAGTSLSRRSLLRSMETHARAWRAFSLLLEARSQGLISATWTTVISHAFLMGDTEAWTDRVNMLLRVLREQPPLSGTRVFLAGSPIFFPNLKVPQLIEEAGMHIAGDELCSSERILAGPALGRDRSVDGLLRSLAEQYHLGCSCPSFTDTPRRLANLLETLHQRRISGVIYHVLKGCHPYDMDSYRYEKIIKERGFSFVRIETDLSREDGKNLLVRLEAFRDLLHERS
jgi:benzoyl-CoA reductase/2-hydroxyglutaryl-CoA dehydratase subunit BcrC/BadD/HgdB